MEFLVTMTTHVRPGTPDAEVDEVRTREAAHSRGLAAHGQLLRLWRPPLQPGEWRTLGLFVAQDADDLEQVLAGMPLRVWRTDEATPLDAHPNDPAAAGIAGRPGKGPEFLVTMTVTVPAGTPDDVVADTIVREASRARELAARGHLIRLWRLPSTPEGPRALGLWRARDPGELMAIVESLPLSGWMTIETVPLTPHPNDPLRLG